jgi:type VI secretion system secreted protein Hcp
MPVSAYLQLKGQRQGNIDGSVTQKGREKSILVHGFDNQISAPHDAATGLPTGKRLHQPVTIVKEVDQSSPKLWTALVNNENLTEWVLKFWSTDLAQPDTEKQIYTVTLTNASIASMREFMGDNQNAAQAKLPLQEQISFTYQKIEWAWANPTTVAMEDWETPAV